MEKAYKLLAQSRNISNHHAKSLIDRGLVSVNGKRLRMARLMLPYSSSFSIRLVPQVDILFKDNACMAINKPALISSEELYQDFSLELVHRLDKETSGVLLLGTKDFKKSAISEYRNKRVYKEYRAVVYGLVKDEQMIDMPIYTYKGKKARSVVRKDGKCAQTFIAPLEYHNKKTLLKVITYTGRTHQIRVHLSSIGFPIIGDVAYGGKESQRMLLHAYRLDIFNYRFCAELPEDFIL